VAGTWQVERDSSLLLLQEFAYTLAAMGFDRYGTCTVYSHSYRVVLGGFSIKERLTVTAVQSYRYLAL
jgi:hypothetical protein